MSNSLNKPKDSLRVAFDLDGVFCNFDRAFAKLLNRLYPRIVPDGYEPLCWSWPDELKPGLEKEGWNLVRRSPNFWRYLPPYPENTAAMRSFLMEIGGHIEVYYVTSKVASAGDSVMEQCNQWLTGHGLLTNQCSVVIKPKNRSKAEIYRALDILFSIDDYDKNVREAIVSSRYGNYPHRPFLLDRSWNRSATDLDDIRLPNLGAYLDIIEKEIVNGQQ